MGLAELMDVFKRHWLLIVLAGILTAGVAFVVGGRTAAVYTTSAKVLVREGLSDGVARLMPAYLRNVDRDWNTRVAGLQSPELAAEVIESEGLDLEPAALAARVTVTSDDRTGLITVAVSDADPQGAADVTNALVRRFADDARASQEKALAQAIASAEAGLAQARARVEALDEPTGTGDQDYLGTGAYEQAAVVVDTLRMGAATQVDPVSIVSEAVAPPVAGAGNARLKTMLFGLFAGLALGVLLALILEYLNRSNASRGTAEA